MNRSQDRFQGKSPVERAKLKADTEIPIDGVKVAIDQALCNETMIISDIFNLNEMDALELVLSEIQATFNVISEFHMLSQPHVNGLGGPKHQNLLRNVIEEIRENAAEALYSLCEWGAEHANEFLMDVYPILKTVWSDQSVCGTAQLACAIALRSLAVNPADHLNITNVEVDVDKVVDRAVRNMAMLFIRHGIIASDSFKQCCSHVRVVDNLLKQLIALFPAKATPALHYENLLRCLSDLYQIVDDPKASEGVKATLIELSTAYSSAGSMELCRFIERARLAHHVVHAVAYLDVLCAVCRTRPVAAFIFDVFAKVPTLDDGCVGWDHVMSALRSYERLFRERPAGTSMFGHTLSVQQQPKSVIPPRELIGLITWINLCRTVIELERQWAVLDAALGVISAPVPLPLKGALLRMIAALAKRESSAHRIWTALNAHQLCTFAENGSLLGLQKELEERECTEEMFDTSLGFVSLLLSLLSHSHITIPEIAAPYLQYLTKSIVSQMGSRSYKDIEQFAYHASICPE
ncbi:unnamed protein product [Nippostrongylus brasiliensis]|uniref:Nuclear pore complex protein Nup205 (inferred by orthology to a human protein) n=1 Tax=Nippostrongylus brasiliensis TaxID=27835 RepID=A0A0N4XZH4_NIPBR|nr:unnamed protein product [Nippostrongylus brasiliensis]